MDRVSACKKSFYYATFLYHFSLYKCTYKILPILQTSGITTTSYTRLLYCTHKVTIHVKCMCKNLNIWAERGCSCMKLVSCPAPFLVRAWRGLGTRLAWSCWYNIALSASTVFSYYYVICTLISLLCNTVSHMHNHSLLEHSRTKITPLDHVSCHGLAYLLSFL